MENSSTFELAISLRLTNLDNYAHFQCIENHFSILVTLKVYKCVVCQSHCFLGKIRNDLFW